MGLESPKVRALITRIYGLKPYNEANFKFLTGGIGSDWMRVKGAMMPSPNGERSRFLYDMGRSNIATLVAEGFDLKDLQPANRVTTLKATDRISWTEYGGVYLWESAAVATPAECVAVLKRGFPLVDKNAWDKAYTGLMRRA